MLFQNGQLKPGGLCWCKCWPTTKSSSQTEKHCWLFLTTQQRFTPYIPNWKCWCATCPEIPWKPRDFGGSFKAYHTQSWRSGTASQYQTYYKKWELFCRQQNINPLRATLQDGINFLAQLFATGVGYSCINTARSALPSLNVLPGSIKFGSHPLVTRFVKGEFKVRKALSRYKDIWDVNKVFKFLAAWTLGEGLSLKCYMETHDVTCLFIRSEGPNIQSTTFVFNDLVCNQMFIYHWHTP